MQRFASVAATSLAVLTALALTTLPGSGRPHPAPTAYASPAASVRGHAEQGPLEALFGSENRRMRTTRRVVALTFNAAWDETGVATVLDVLRERHVPATFFPTGQFAERHPAAVRAMAAEHGIGSHSYSHPLFDDLTCPQAADEVLRADRAIRAAAGKEPLPFFRFPYSATTPRGIACVNELGYADIEFTTDTQGYLGPAGGITVQKAVDRVVRDLVPGQIVQMHVGADTGQDAALDAEALPRIIDAVQARGYRIVDLGAVLLPRQG
ncbi:transposase [Streptomyces griseocarneus]|nr:transposase [Streptomyces griseocarneus]